MCLKKYKVLKLGNNFDFGVNYSKNLKSYDWVISHNYCLPKSPRKEARDLCLVLLLLTQPTKSLKALMLFQ